MAAQALTIAETPTEDAAATVLAVVEQQQRIMRASRSLIETVIERLIERLDAADGDPDFEATCEDEGAACDDEGFDADSEGSLCGVRFGIGALDDCEADGPAFQFVQSEAA